MKKRSELIWILDSFIFPKTFVFLKLKPFVIKTFSYGFRSLLSAHKALLSIFSLHLCVSLSYITFICWSVCLTHACFVFMLFLCFISRVDEATVGDLNHNLEINLCTNKASLWPKNVESESNGEEKKDWLNVKTTLPSTGFLHVSDRSLIILD